jgi:ribonucleotide reductase alpha subunit
MQTANWIIKKSGHLSLQTMVPSNTWSILDEWTKDIYKTSMEIDQRWIVDHAANRQKYIDQAQSINLFFRPDVNVKVSTRGAFHGLENQFKTLVLLP